MNKPNETKELRQFALIMASMIVLIFALLLPWIYEWSFSWTPYAIAGVFAFLGLAAPGILGPIHHLWIKFSHVLGLINSKILLFFIFFLIFTPMGLIARIFGFNPMKKNLKTNSYYIKREQNINNMENPF